MNGIFITEKYCQKHKNKIDMLHTIIHEYAHAISYELTKGIVNPVVEEAMVNIFAEMSINYYIQKGNNINYISKEENETIHKNNGYFEHDSYIDEGQFTRGLMYALKIKNMDMTAFEEYFFGDKGNFVSICENILGYRTRHILENDLANVQNFLGEENNTHEYLPKAIRDLKYILGEYYNSGISENNVFTIQNGNPNNFLYRLDTSFMDAVLFENKLQYETFNMIDFSHITRDNVQKIFSNLTIEKLEQISAETNGRLIEISSQYGYSHFVKSLIKGWYITNKDNLENFEKILSLTGGIPLDIFKYIIDDLNITEINDILKLMGRFQGLTNPKDHDEVLNIINSRIGNIPKNVHENQNGQENDETAMYNYLNDITIKCLASMKLNDDELRKILCLYNNSYANISFDNIQDVIDILKKSANLELTDENNTLLTLCFDISACICEKENNGEVDLGVLISACRLPNGMGEEIYNSLIFQDSMDIFDNVGIAIDTLKKYGYFIQNEYEILDYLQAENYKDIRFFPELTSSSLYAFMGEPDKTKILLNACVTQFLENLSPNFFDNPENYQTCLMLLDQSNQNSLCMSDFMRKRICSMMEEKIQNSDVIDNEKRELLNNELQKNYRSIDKAEGSKILAEYFNSLDDETEIPLPLVSYLMDSSASRIQASEIVKFFKVESGSMEPEYFNYNLSNINNILDLLENSNIDPASDGFNSGQELLVNRLMAAARTVEIDNNNIDILRIIFEKLKTIQGLDEETIKESLFGDEDIMNRICANSTLLDSAVQATTELTREGSITNQSQQIINEVEQQNNIEHQEDKEYNNG